MNGIKIGILGFGDKKKREGAIHILVVGVKEAKKPFKGEI